ncbi:MAG: SsrA-binding protein SmpB [Planctomycetota bacterium]|nr:SsrA-binding protein SmpB [Planctomycetota bacterium]
MAKKAQAPNNTPTIENRRARFEYHIGETLEVGMLLRGSEVKSVRDGKVSLAEGFVMARTDPLHLELLNVEIGEYSPAAALGHRPKRSRTLLAHKREIVKLAKALETKGATIVPLRLYFKNGYAKLLIAVAKGKTAHDKREAIGKREADRDIQRAMSRRR